MNHEAIVISGGGCKGITLLGLLYEYHERRLLTSDILSVCSVGAFIGVLLLCNINPLKILSFYPKNIEKITPSMGMLSTLVAKSGFLRIQKYTKKFCAAVEKFVGIENPTLQQFYEKTHKLIYIQAVNGTDCEVVYFNHITHPDVPLFSAVWASAAIPGVFIPIKIDGESYCDGGVYTATPLEPVRHLRTLAFTFVNKKDENIISNVLKFHSTLVKKEAIKRHAELKIIECESNFGVLDFGKTTSEILEEFNYGRTQFVSDK